MFAPISISISCIFVTVSRSCLELKCIGETAITPGTRLLPTITRLPGSILSSMPPISSNLRRPCSVMPVTISPTSSICASAINFFSELLPFLKAIIFPILSTFMLSQKGVISLKTISLTSSSNPLGEKASVSFLRLYIFYKSLISKPSANAPISSASLSKS